MPYVVSWWYVSHISNLSCFFFSVGSQNAQFYTLRTAKALAMTALDVIFKPGLLEEVREDFRQVKLKEEGQIKPVEPNKESGIGTAACASHYTSLILSQ